MREDTFAIWFDCVLLFFSSFYVVLESNNVLSFDADWATQQLVSLNTMRFVIVSMVDDKKSPHIHFFTWSDETNKCRMLSGCYCPTNGIDQPSQAPQTRLRIRIIHLFINHIIHMFLFRLCIKMFQIRFSLSPQHTRSQWKFSLLILIIFFSRSFFSSRSFFLFARFFFATEGHGKQCYGKRVIFSIDNMLKIIQIHCITLCVAWFERWLPNLWLKVTFGQFFTFHCALLKLIVMDWIRTHTVYTVIQYSIWTLYKIILWRYIQVLMP